MTELHQGFNCPKTKIELSIPCGIEKCSYFIDNSWTKNCVLNYMHHQGVDKLTPTEISFLYKMPIERVNYIKENQLMKMRKNVLKNKLKNKNKITYIKNIPICCVCESKVNKGIVKEGFTFCNKTCLKQKPLYVFKIEEEYGNDINTILNTVFSTFKSLDIIERMLNIQRKKLEFMINNIAPNLTEKFSNLSNSNEIFSFKEKVSKVCEKNLNKMKKSLNQFGTPKKTLETMYDKFTLQLEGV